MHLAFPTAPFLGADMADVAPESTEIAHIMCLRYSECASECLSIHICVCVK